MLNASLASLGDDASLEACQAIGAALVRIRGIISTTASWGHPPRKALASAGDPASFARSVLARVCRRTSWLRSKTAPGPSGSSWSASSSGSRGTATTGAATRGARAWRGAWRPSGRPSRRRAAWTAPSPRSWCGPRCASATPATCGPSTATSPRCAPRVAGDESGLFKKSSLSGQPPPQTHESFCRCWCARARRSRPSRRRRRRRTSARPSRRRPTCR